jgi:hypothetical protein
MSWVQAFGHLHSQLRSVHPLASLEATVDRQTMISIAREMNLSLREEIDPSTIDVIRVYDMKISVRD